MRRFCILNFTQFSLNRLLTMKYYSVKDCNSSQVQQLLHLRKDMPNSQRYPLYLYLINNVVVCVARNDDRC